MQQVGLSLLPEQYQMLSKLLKRDFLEITEVTEQPNNMTNEQVTDVLAKLLKKTFDETKQILDKF